MKQKKSTLSYFWHYFPLIFPLIFCLLLIFESSFYVWYGLFIPVIFLSALQEWNFETFLILFSPLLLAPVFIILVFGIAFMLSHFSIAFYLIVMAIYIIAYAFAFKRLVKYVHHKKRVICIWAMVFISLPSFYFAYHQPDCRNIERAEKGYTQVQRQECAEIQMNPWSRWNHSISSKTNGSLAGMGFASISLVLVMILSSRILNGEKSHNKKPPFKNRKVV